MPNPQEAPAPLSYYMKNRDHLANSGPSYPPFFFELGHWQKTLAKNMEEFRSDESAKLFIYERTPDGFGAVIIGSVNLTTFVRRSAQFCYLGYGLDEDRQGLGYMTEAVRAVVKFAFGDLNLHRIMANYMPENERSGKLLKRLGFIVEGYAREYLYINGVWQDHIMTALTNPDWRSDRT